MSNLAPGERLGILKPPGFGEVDAAAGSDVLTVESTPSTVEYFYDAALTSMW